MQDAVAIEGLEIAHEGLEQVILSRAGGRVMVTIQHLEVRFDVDGDDEEAVFARLFDKYIRRWNRAMEEERARLPADRARAAIARRRRRHRMTTPLSAVRAGPGEGASGGAEADRAGADHPAALQPDRYQLQKANNFAEIAIPGLESPPIQFVRGGAEKLTLGAVVDTSDTLEDVRESTSTSCAG